LSIINANLAEDGSPKLDLLGKINNLLK